MLTVERQCRTNRTSRANRTNHTYRFLRALMLRASAFRVDALRGAGRRCVHDLGVVDLGVVVRRGIARSAIARSAIARGAIARGTDRDDVIDGVDVRGVAHRQPSGSGLARQGLRRRAAVAASAAIAAIATNIGTIAMLLMTAQPASAQAPTAAASGAAAPLRYRVVNLAPGELTASPQMNASGQAAFALADGVSQLAWFFDGKQVRSLGTLGGSIAVATGLNSSAQVSGYSSGPGDVAYHAFRWSAATGMLDLGTLNGGESSGAAINGKGEVVGYSGGQFDPLNAFRWNLASGMENLGTLAGGTSVAVALNDSGLVSGYADNAAGDTHAFIWTRSRGIEDIGTLGGSVSYPSAVGAKGEVAGYAEPGNAPGVYHAFFWTRAGGMRDLGTLGGSESFVLAMSPQAHIAGVISAASGYQRAISWTAASGMVDLGTFGGPGARALAVSGKDQIVGWALDAELVYRAFSWTSTKGIVDLNQQLVNAPAGLLVDAAAAVSDNGAIVATSNAGLVLLRPLGQAVLDAPVVGPILAPALVRAGRSVTLKLAFNDADSRELHHADLQWGDASMETALVSEQGGSGSVAASHVYRQPGVYTIIARVSDAAGHTTTVKRELVVEGAGQHAAGSGRLLLPQGADRHAPGQAGPASFSFVAPSAQAAGSLRFHTTRLAFSSTAMGAAMTVGGGQRVSGTGRLNGQPGYRYSLTVAGAAANGKGQFGLRIWHSNPLTKADVVDFDNQQTSAARAMAVTEGAIAVAP